MDLIRQYCKSAIKTGLFYERSINPFRRGRIQGCKAVILQYHSVGPAQSTALYVNPNLSITPEHFERQIAFVADHFRIVTLDQLMEHAENPSASETLFAVTFDDGYRDNFAHALPILRRHNVPALFYLTTACINSTGCLWTSEIRHLVLESPKPCISLSTLADAYALDTAENRMKALELIKHRMVAGTRREREEILRELRSKTGVANGSAPERIMLSWDEVRAMRRNGMMFGSHTLSHPSLTYLPSEEAKREIAESRNELSSQLDEEIAHFSYPNPAGHLNYNTELKRIVENAGYRSAATSRPGYLGATDDRFELKRKGIYAIYSKLPDFYLWIMKEAILQRWNSLPGTGLRVPSPRTRTAP